MPPLLNIIALATFAASLSTRAMDPVLPHVADDLSVTVATAAGLSAVTAFSFAIVQPMIGAAADIFGKGRLMLVCLVLLGIANIVGAFCTSYTHAVRDAHFCGNRIGRRFSGRARHGERPRAGAAAAGRDRPHARGLDDRQPARRLVFRRDRRSRRLARRAGRARSAGDGRLDRCRNWISPQRRDRNFAADEVCRSASRLPDRSSGIPTQGSVIPPFLSKAAACLDCFLTSRRFCSNSAKPGCRSRASSSPDLRSAGCFTP